MVNVSLSDIKHLIQQNTDSKGLINILISILEKSESIETRLELLEFLSKYDLMKSPYFGLFENYLVSDAWEEIRALASEIIFRNFIEQGLDALEWTIINDPSPLVLRTIYSLAKGSNDSLTVVLESVIFEKFKRIAQKYKLDVEEVPFILDIGINFMNQNIYRGNQDFHFIYENDIMCIIKKEHITELGVSFKKQIPETIGLLSELEHLDLSFSFISTLPNSLIQLENLQSIDLSWNEFAIIPNILRFLKRLTYLNLSSNKIKYIPDWASKIDKLIL